MEEVGGDREGVGGHRTCSRAHTWPPGGDGRGMRGREAGAVATLQDRLMLGHLGGTGEGEEG